MELAAINNRVAEVQGQLERLGYPKINVNAKIATLKPGVAGLAQRYGNTITISKEYLKENFDEVIHRTVAHEVCHLYVMAYKPMAKQAHGPEFRGFMALLGVDGSTHHNMERPDGMKRQTRTKTRFVYITERSKREVMLTSIQHKKASSGIKFLYKGESISFAKKSVKIY